MTPARKLLTAALVALAAVYATWFGLREHWGAVAVFAVPPLWLAIRLLRGGGARTAFWAGVLALVWFSHGVMVGWTRPMERGYAWIAIALSLLVVFSASLPGLRARFSRGR